MQVGRLVHGDSSGVTLLCIELKGKEKGVEIVMFNLRDSQYPTKRFFVGDMMFNFDLIRIRHPLCGIIIDLTGDCFFQGLTMLHQHALEGYWYHKFLLIY